MAESLMVKSQIALGKLLLRGTIEPLCRSTDAK
jgi:hypothetical protein